MKVFLLGAPCAGKTTLLEGLQGVLDCPLLDMDAELVRLNGGSWPSLDVKRDLASRVIREARDARRWCSRTASWTTSSSLRWSLPSG